MEIEAKSKSASVWLQSRFATSYKRYPPRHMKYKRVLSIVGWMSLGLCVFVFYLYSASRTAPAVKRALGDSQCEPVSVGANFGPEYTGALIDTHIHIPDAQIDWLFPIGTALTLGDYACTFRLEGTQQVFAFFPVYKGFDEQQLAIVQAAEEKYSDLFVPFIMPPDNDGSIDGFPTVSAGVLSQMLDKTPGLFAGYGEIGLYARGDHGGEKGAPALPPDSARMQEIYPVVRKHNLLTYFHLGEGQQASFERAAAANRDINFIFHGDQLVIYGENGQNLEVIDGILYRNPNVYYGVDELYGDIWLLRPEVSKEEFLAHFEKHEELMKKDVAIWKPFIERHPDQVLFGTDRGWFGGWPMDPDVGIYLTRYARAFINHLDPAVQENFAYKNAKRLRER